jgi:hypothetical protein
MRVPDQGEYRRGQPRSYSGQCANSPSLPLGAERVGVRWGEPRHRRAAPFTSPSPSPKRRVPSLSPHKRAERAKIRAEWRCQDSAGPNLRNTG